MTFLCHIAVVIRSRVQIQTDVCKVKTPRTKVQLSNFRRDFYKTLTIIYSMHCNTEDPFVHRVDLRFK
jgi:hypothetical protein